MDAPKMKSDEFVLISPSGTAPRFQRQTLCCESLAKAPGQPCFFAIQASTFSSIIDSGTGPVRKITS